MSDTASHEVLPATLAPHLKLPRRFSHSRSQSADLESMGSGSVANTRSSIDSGSDKPRSQTGDGVDNAPKSHHSGLSKLLAGSRRRRRKKEKWRRDDGRSSTGLSSENGRDLRTSRSTDSPDGNSVAASSFNDNQSREENEIGTLLTDDSEPDPSPPFHTGKPDSGFYTTSNPVINVPPNESNNLDKVDADVESAASGPSAGELGAPSKFARTVTEPNPGLSVPGDNSSKKRSVSPRRRLKEAFGSSNDKLQTSTSPGASKNDLANLSNGSKNSLTSKRSMTFSNSATPRPPPIITDHMRTTFPELPKDDDAPRTPPLTAVPLTTVTPPSPGDRKTPSAVEPTDSSQPAKQPNPQIPGIVVSHSGNMISHRRVRSASAASHKPSKLSSSVSALSPTVEESKTPGSRTPSGNQPSGFFSTVLSAAQNAATSISSTLNSQSRSRTMSQAVLSKADDVPADNEAEYPDGASGENKPSERKPSAVDTLGTGDLNFSQLDLDFPPGGVISTNEGVVITKPDAHLEKRKNAAAEQRDEEAAKREDRNAAQAVSTAYEKQNEDSSSTYAEDGAELQSSVSKDAASDRTPGGSVINGESGTLGKRSGSVRSRLTQRHRRSSAATTSTVGAIGAGAIAMGIAGANTSVPRLTGFAIASKKRNRDFHQLFRSVPEDDYLIEDYSCALQREIILTGRIYISEGHICFSSNILGWVTNLVISFDEIVAIEKETTAMIFANAIAIQTLHARHTFRSLLSRESTYDLMVNIWKINHPAIQSSVNGTRVDQGTGDKTEKTDGIEGDDDDSDEDEIYDEDEDDNNADGFFDADDRSAHGSDRSVSTRDTSPESANATVMPLSSANGDLKNGDKSAAAGGLDINFPGPATHAPTEYTDPAGRYERVVKEDVVPAPLGKVYSLIFGTESAGFMSKFMAENQKCTELQWESDKKGLTNEAKQRQYQYIKPLPGSIGPRQTKCISTETLDFFDLEKAVLVTLSTQTPDVPSGNVFSTKTKYLLTWAPGNQTRLVMSCVIEWTGKSWFKGPIEKHAYEGQGSFGNELVKSLKGAVVSRGRTPKSGKGKGRRKKDNAAIQEAAATSAAAAAVSSAEKAASWGPLEPFYRLLSPLFDLLRPLVASNIGILIIATLLAFAFFRGRSPSPDVGYPGWTVPQRLAVYEDLWQREENELWNWLEDRVGLDGMSYPAIHQATDSKIRQSQLRRKAHGKKDVASRLSEEKMSNREMAYAIRTTRERLDVLEEVLSKQEPALDVDGYQSTGDASRETRSTS